MGDKRKRSEKDSKSHKKDKKHKKEKKSRHYSSSDTEKEVRRQVRALKRQQREQAIRNAPIGDDEQPDNIYGDANLGQKFLWQKKVETDIRSGKRDRYVSSGVSDYDRARAEELERVRARRAQNDADFVKRQEDIGELERRRLAAEAVKEAAKEEQFHLKQNVDRARRRLDECRAQAIDELVQMLWLQASHPSDPTTQPYDVFRDFRIDELRSLMAEVQDFKVLDVEDAEHAAYWQNLHDLMRWKVEEEQAAEEADRLAVRDGTHAAPVHQAVSGDVEAIMAGRSYQELLELEAQVLAELGAPTCSDPDFWRAVKSRLAVNKARTRLREIYRAAIKSAAGSAPCGPASKAVPAGQLVPHDSAPAASRSRSPSPDPVHHDESDDDSAGGEGPGGEAPEWMRLSDGRFSPPPLAAQLVAGQDVENEEEDRETLLLLRLQVREEADRTRVPVAGSSAGVRTGGSVRGGEVDRATDALKHKALAAMGDSPDELVFGGMVPLESVEYWWREKYKPRKPKFFNKVHTGYDWNKYNRAHYDVDNPPPKVVQGYKFNVFYPDLLDKRHAPTYKVVPDPTCSDESTVLLVFSAGPPYEDVAFRIVNKEWDRGPKKGFKNVFERDMLQLYFNFKRNPYRR